MTVSPLNRLWGSALKGLRLVARKSIDEAASGLGQDRSMVSRFENGQRIPSPELVERLLGCYGIPQSVQSQIAATAHALQVGGWWSPHVGDVNRDLLDYVWCEWHATELQVFEPLLVPGLLQTSGYMEALIGVDSHAKSSAQARRWLSFRKKRQDLFEVETSPQIQIVLYEAALRCQVGDEAVMRQQFDHLLRMAQSPNVDIRVLTFEAAAKTALQGEFTIFTLPQPLEIIAVTQTGSMNVFLESRAAIDDQAADFARILRGSLSGAESLELVGAMRKNLR
ncbi:helix-turn-helix protein [Stackebrandtia endophytica]|uniref:Helix-turn-helix protein n=1 Tax=Stackebrandtia endophytica TaxID=1496996 RepID=A0A543ARD3_9ACTN|nr:helix-turn-helix transcriptional regulator [Stackebrandtia endophytica]TQL75141.1 helix-turn-helix protein [Stackebrandtia endophytica]